MTADNGDIINPSPSTKYGRVLDIALGAISFDGTGQLLKRAKQLGAKARAKRLRLLGLSDDEIKEVSNVPE